MDHRIDVRLREYALTALLVLEGLVLFVAAPLAAMGMRAPITIGGLFLTVELSGIGHGGDHPKILGPFVAIIHAEQLAFPSCWLQGLFLEDFKEVRSFAETGSGIGCGEGGWIVGCKVPGGGSAHGEAANGDSILIHPVVGTQHVESFIGIDLAGQF